MLAKRIEAKHPLAIRWFHWINFPVITMMIWSGLLIYWANDVYRIGFGSHTLIHFFPDWFYAPVVHGLRVSAAGDSDSPLYSLNQRLAEGMAWHFFFMWLFVGNGILYVAYTLVSGEWRALLPNRSSFHEAVQVMLHDLHLRREPLPRRKFNGAQQIAYTTVILMGAGSALTGLSIFRPVQFGWVAAVFGGYKMARFIHFWMTVGYCLFFVVHITQVVRAGWNNFRAMVTGHELVIDDVPDPRPSRVPETELTAPLAAASAEEGAL